MRAFGKSVTVALALVFAMAGSLPAENPPDEAPANQLRVSGKVLLPDGSPADGAVVSFRRGNLDWGAAVANRSGGFRLQADFLNQPALYFRSADGKFQATRHTSEALARRYWSAPLEVRLQPAREIVVTVMAAEKPVERAQVVLTGNLFQTEQFTDRDGIARLLVPHQEVIRGCVAWHPQLGIAKSGDFENSESKTAATVSLLPTKSHRLVVLDQDGKPIGNLPLRTYIALKTDAGPPEYIDLSQIQALETRTNSAGEANIEWAPRERLTGVFARFMDDQWSFIAYDHDQVANGVSKLRLKRKTASIQGTVKLPDGNSAEGMMVWAVAPGPTWDNPRTRVRVDNSFSLPALSGLTYAVGLTDMDWTSDVELPSVQFDAAVASLPVTIEPRPTVPVSIKVSRGRDRIPVTRAWLHASSTHRYGTKVSGSKSEPFTYTNTLSCFTDDAGEIHLALRKGEHRLRMFPLTPGSWDAERLLAIADDRPQNVEFHRPWRGNRTFQVRLTQEGSAVERPANLQVRLEAKEGDYRLAKPEPRWLDSGRFQFEADAEQAMGYAHDPVGKLNGFARFSADDKEFELPLQPTAVFSGQIVNLLDEPFANSRVDLRVDGTTIEVPADAITDAAGRFRFQAAPSGVPVWLQVTNASGREVHQELRRYFEPGEQRENVRVVIRTPASAAERLRPSPATLPLPERLKKVTRDAGLASMRALIVLQGSDEAAVSEFTSELLNYEDHRAVLGFLPLTASPAAVAEGTEELKSRAWPAPKAGEVVLVVLDGAGKMLANHRAFPANQEALQNGRHFLSEHIPPKHDARQVFSAALEAAQQSQRKAWIVVGGPRCGPCFRLARWMDQQRPLLEKDYVFAKVSGGWDDSVEEVEKLVQMPVGAGIPWFSILDSAGKVLATSEGPLGNMGFPTTIEEFNHVRRILKATAQRLTADEVERLVESLKE